MSPIVIALGGNTLLGRHGRWTIEEQIEVIEGTASLVADIVRSGTDVVLTHGNGPQIGHLLLQQENTPDVPQLPLDVLVAETQAQIGYLLQRALDNELLGLKDVMSVLTQVIVDPNDPAFGSPDKPVGPYYSAAEAKQRTFPTRKLSDDERGYRRLVASPEPREIVEAKEIGQLLKGGSLVICAGGGGIPVVRRRHLRGVDAVIDKDKTSQLLASSIGTDTLVILTDIDAVYLGFGRSNERPLHKVAVTELRRHLEADEFQEGTMKPKIQAALRFIEGGGKRTIITSPASLEEALEGSAGTQVTQ